eukprot:TRINITY_DN16660_c0_g1_i1.p1 TRINITY_DN16660_c0_g1~~TRINITY_DN16660_c0_g1_i1.p1  ORF type:complete len:100 (+),score=18.87 TRINITY_DN16660_c0_g1_i1:63-362(+)
MNLKKTLDKNTMLSRYETRTNNQHQTNTNMARLMTVTVTNYHSSPITTPPHTTTFLVCNQAKPESWGLMLNKTHAIEIVHLVYLKSRKAIIQKAAHKGD